MRSKGLILFSAAIALAHLFGGSAADFQVYAGAARRWLSLGAGAVYDPASLTPFKYHPVTLWFFAPLGALPLLPARVVWAALQGFLCWDIGRALGRRGVSTRSYLLAALWVIHAWTWQFKFGNVTVLMLWLFVRWIVAERDTVKGAALTALVLLKPQWALLGGLRLVVGNVRETLWTALFLAVGSLAVFLTGLDAGTLLYRGWLATLGAPIHAHNYPKHDNQSWFGLLYRHTEEPTALLALSAVAAAALLAFWYLRVYAPAKRTWRPWLAVPVLLQWMGPLSWIHQEILLLPLVAERLENEGLAPSLFFAWLCFNGTGQLFLGYEGFVRVNQWGLPLLGCLALLVAAATDDERRALSEPRFAPATVH